MTSKDKRKSGAEAAEEEEEEDRWVQSCWKRAKMQMPTLSESAVRAVNQTTRSVKQTVSRVPQHDSPMKDGTYHVSH